ncbi:MAG: hypothetical protein GY822_08525 [Deltaproteobacteria bacterium]|nr:hypothetical protein [Deltaproteobacteria bacterium]
MLRVIVFAFLVLPFTVAKLQSCWVFYQENEHLDLVETAIASLLSLLFLGYCWSFFESIRDAFYEHDE